MQDLTIIIPSYNRGKYIKECLDSIFMQKTSYSFHLIIPDDHSTDDSIEIIKEYQAKYPNKITLLESNVNQKLYKNVLRAYELTKTPYFTVLDPDDFWIDENFIQNGLNFLEKNKDFSIYATNAYIQNEYDINSRKPFVDIKQEKNITFQDFLKAPSYIGCTGATIFRNTVFANGIPDKLNSEINFIDINHFRGDTFRNLLHLSTGNAFYFPTSITTVYRQTYDGIYAGSSDLKRNILNAGLFADLYSYFDEKYPQFLEISKNYIDKTNKSINISDIVLQLKYYKILDYLKTNRGSIVKLKLQKINLKYRIYYLLYNFFRKKLLKKGLI